MTSPWKHVVICTRNT